VRHRECERQGLGARDRVRVERELQRVHREHRQHQAGDRSEDEQGVAVLEIVTLEARGMKHQSPVECERNRRQHENAKEVLRRRVEPVERRGEKGERERGEASVEQQLGCAHR